MGIFEILAVVAVAALAGLVFLVGRGGDEQDGDAQLTGDRTEHVESTGTGGLPADDDVGATPATDRVETSSKDEAEVSARAVVEGETEVTAGGPPVSDQSEGEDEEVETDVRGDGDGERGAGEPAAEDGEAGGELEVDDRADDQEPAYIGKPSAEAFDPESGEVIFDSEGDRVEEEGESAGAETGEGSDEASESAKPAEGLAPESDAMGEGPGGEFGAEMSEDEELWDVPDSVLSDAEDAVEDVDEGTLDSEGREASDRPEAEPESEPAEGTPDPESRDATGGAEPGSEGEANGEDGAEYGVVNRPEDDTGDEEDSSDEEPSVLGFDGPRSGSTDEPGD